MALSLSACYWNEDVTTNQVAVKLNKNAIIEVVGAGVYTDGAWFSDIRPVDIGTQTFTVNDPEVMTKDNQAVGLTVTIQARRKADDASVRNMFTNWSSLLDNTSMVNTISATAREGMKNGVRSYNLTQLLDDRNGLSDAISTQLELDSSEYGVEIINVTIENIVIDPGYLAMLQQKALLRAETEKELQRQDLIKQQAENDILQAQNTAKVLDEQLIVAQAQTTLDVEIASREGKKVAEANRVYETNEQAFVLEQLRLMKDIFGDKTMFVSEGVKLNTFLGLGSNTTVMPYSGE